MPLVLIGKIGRPHGIRGELNVEDVSLSPAELAQVARFVWRGRGGEERALTLAGARQAHDRMLMAFAEAADRERAAGLTLGRLFAEAERLPDPGPSVAYAFQLIGLRVETEDGRALGAVAEVVTSGPQPVYVVRGERELLIPGVPEFLKRVDLAAGRIVVALPAGLEEL